MQISAESPRVPTGSGDLIATLHDLELALQELTPQIWRDSDGVRVVMATLVAGEEIKICASFADRILHLQLFFPFSAPPRLAASVALAVCGINERLAIPGFGLQAASGRVYYRISTPLPEAGIDKKMLFSLVATCVGTAADYALELSATAEPHRVPQLPPDSPVRRESPPAADPPSAGKFEGNGAYAANGANALTQKWTACRGTFIPQNDRSREDDATSIAEAPTDPGPVGRN